MRIDKARMTVIPRGLNIGIESRHRGSRRSPRARLASGSAVINVVINNGRGMVFVDLSFRYRNKAARSRVDDIVRKNIVRHIPLHLELAGTRSRRIVFVESVVDHSAVLGVSPL